MTARNFAVVAAFAVPVFMVVALIFAVMLHSGETTAGLLGGLAGNAFSWPGRIIAALFKELPVTPPSA